MVSALWVQSGAAQAPAEDETTAQDQTEQAPVDPRPATEQELTPAADPNAPPEPTPSREDELEAKVLELEVRIEQLERDTAEEVTKVASDPESKLQLSDTRTVVPERRTLQEDQATAPRPGNASVDPALEGFGHIPGTKLWFKFGGYAKIDGMFDMPNVGNPNEFRTATIPVGSEGTVYGTRQFNLHAKQSRLNLDLRSPTKIGAIRAYYENDFFGEPTDPNLAFRVRHLYVQLANITVGHTWSVFTDPDAVPDTLDFAGPGGRVGARQPQLRYTYSPIKEHLHLAVSVEQPRSDLGQAPADVEERNVTPDFACNVRWESEYGHIQGGTVLRALAIETDEADARRRLGWGVSISGSVFPFASDSLVGQVNLGNGIGRYLQDLTDGYGGYVNAEQRVRLVPAWGAYLSYKHFWVDNMSSSFTYGYLRVNAPDELGDDAYELTHYVQANFVWSPIPNLFIGAEQLWGRRRVQSGDYGNARRSQLSFKYAFSL